VALRAFTGSEETQSTVSCARKRRRYKPPELLLGTVLDRPSAPAVASSQVVAAVPNNGIMYLKRISGRIDERLQDHANLAAGSRGIKGMVIDSPAPCTPLPQRRVPCH
jgi:hypothetical protein